MNRQVQLVNGERYLRGLIEEGPRKSLEPMVTRLGVRLTMRACSSSWR